MPLHRNECASQRTLNFTGLDTYVKENYSLARERDSNCVCTSSKRLFNQTITWICIQGKRKRTKVNAPENVHYQWAPKGSYRLKQMLKTISHLANRFNMFIPKKRCDLCIRWLQCPSVTWGKGGAIETRLRVCWYWWRYYRRHTGKYNT